MATYTVPAVIGAQYVVLPSGGARGMALVGVLEALKDLCGVDFGTDHDAGGARRLKGTAGTSIGALFALLLALGYSTIEIRAVLNGLEQNHLAAPNPLLVFSDLAAADDGMRLRATLSSFVAKKLGVNDTTLADLLHRTGVDLVTVATDTTTASVRYLRASTEPTMSVVQAVYASMALPPLYPPLVYSDHVLQDGGGMDYLPVGVWGAAAKAKTLSVVLHWANEHVTRDARSILAYMARSMYCALYPAMVVQWCLLDAVDRAACIVVDAANVSTFEMDLTPALKERIRSKGYQDTAAALKLMAAGLPPHRGARRFARKEALPQFLHALMEEAARQDDALAASQRGVAPACD